MSLENASQAESTTSSTASTTTEGQASQTTATESQSQPASETQTTTPSTEAIVSEYKPNLDFKVYDKEHKFPEWAVPFIKDKQSEEQMRDLFSRAYGLDGLKSKYEKSKEQIQNYTQIESKFNNQTQQLKQLLSLRDNDMGAFLQGVGVTDEMLFNHFEALKRAKEDPIFAAQYKNGLEAKQKYLKVSQEQEELRQQIEGIKAEKELVMKERHINSFESVYNQPSIRDFATKYDKVRGEEAFKNEVIEMGDYLFNRDGKYYPPQEVFKLVMDKYGAFVNLQPEANPAQPPMQQAAKAQPATLPNVGGGGPSVTKPRFTSIEDLQKHYQRKFGDE